MAFQSTVTEAQARLLEAIERGDADLGSMLILGDGQLALKKIAVGPGSNAEVDSGWDLPSGSIVLDVWVNVITAEVTGTTKTLDVGLLSSESGGDADAFIDGISVASTGIKRPLWVATVGSNNTFLGAASTHTVGAKLTGVLIAGEDTSAGGDGFAMKTTHASDAVTAKSVSYSRGDTHVELSAEIFVLYAILSATPAL